MPPASIDEIKNIFLIFGYLSESARPELREKIKNYRAPLNIHEFDGKGAFFYSKPSHAEIADSEHMLWIKLGEVHDSERCYSTLEMVQKGWLSEQGVMENEFQGSVTLVGFLKKEARCYIFRNILSSSGVRFWHSGNDLLVSDNLRLLSHFMPEATFDESTLIQHHIYRKVFGDGTYIQDAKNLLGGQIITWEPGNFHLELIRDFRSYNHPRIYKSVNSENIDWFFGKLSKVIGFYLNGREQNAGTMLSGGIDSSTIQVAINQQPNISFPFPSFSYKINSPGFQFEVEYAKEAARLLGTDHSFIEILPEKYRDWLIRSISILVQPIQFDAPPSYFAVAEYLATDKPEIRYLFNGEPADDLLGNPKSLELVSADKYRNWPIWVLNLLAAGLQPVSQSKYFGVHSAAEILLQSKDPTSHNHFVNQSSTCDWELIMSAFPSQAIRDVFSTNQDLIARYSSTDRMVEQIHIFDLLSHGMNIPSLTRQLGLFFGREILFPFSDDALLEAANSFKPFDRYTYDHRVKPLMKLALESQVSMSVTRKPKGYSSAFEQTIIPWMREGSLRPLVQEIDRPGYISKTDFQKVLNDPGWFTWNQLTLDLFKKYGLQ